MNEVPDEVELIANAVERIPIVGPFWADSIQLLFGVADAMNLRRLQTVAPLRTSHDRKVVFLY